VPPLRRCGGLGVAAASTGTPRAAAAGSQLIDFAMRQIPAEHIQAAGYAGVINYVPRLGPVRPSADHPALRQVVERAGLVIVSNYQYGKPGGTAPSDFTRGGCRRRRRRLHRRQLHTAAGGGKSAPIYFCR
jgi:hypothetical protein